MGVCMGVCACVRMYGVCRWAGGCDDLRTGYSGHATLRQRRVNVDAISWRCIDVDATLYKRHVPAGISCFSTG